jgi:hypothetical protein
VGCDLTAPSRLPLLPQIGGAPPPPGSPNRVVNIGNGAQFLLGTYDAATETFTPWSPAGEKPGREALLERGGASWFGASGGADNNGRMMMIGWATPDFTGDSGPGIGFLTRESASVRVGVSVCVGQVQPEAPRERCVLWSRVFGSRSTQAPLSPLCQLRTRPPAATATAGMTLVREVNWDVATGNLVSNPLPELTALRNGTLASESGVPLGPQAYVVPGTAGGVAASADINITFSGFGPNASATFGVCFLANATAGSGLGVSLSIGSAPNASYYMPGIDLPGSDYNVTNVAYSDPHICQAACTADGAKCAAYTCVGLDRRGRKRRGRMGERQPPSSPSSTPAATSRGRHSSAHAASSPPSPRWCRTRRARAAARRRTQALS